MRRALASRLLFVVVLLAGLLATGRGRAAAPPAFTLSALGVLGGDDDANLTAFLLERAGQPSERLLVDGGTVVDGAARIGLGRERYARATPGERADAALAVLATVKAALVTHAHLDHTAGLVVGAAPLLLGRAPGAPPLEIVGLPETLDGIHRQLLAPPAWVDFTVTPKERAPLRLAPLAPLRRRVVGAFTVTAVPLHHAVPSAAFLVEAGGASYLHLGDTGPTEAVWAQARPLVGHGLRAVAIEASFPSEEEALAIATGHLTPALILGELAKLAGIAPSGRARAALVAALRDSLPGVRVIVIHVKARGFDRVAAEIAQLRGLGLDVVLPAQGDALSF